MVFFCLRDDGIARITRDLYIVEELRLGLFVGSDILKSEKCVIDYAKRF